MSQIAVELVPNREQGGFTAQVPDIPAYGEGETEEEAIADLRGALRDFIDTLGLDYALDRLVSSGLRRLDWDLAELVSD
jgi:predicted RNase H-like HicB family nuclease